MKVPDFVDPMSVLLFLCVLLSRAELTKVSISCWEPDTSDPPIACPFSDFLMLRADVCYLYYVSENLLKFLLSLGEKAQLCNLESVLIV